MLSGAILDDGGAAAAIVLGDGYIASFPCVVGVSDGVESGGEVGIVVGVGGGDASRLAGFGADRLANLEFPAGVYNLIHVP